MAKRKLLLLISVLMFITSNMFSQAFQYIGATKCKICHNKEATGDQYKKWTESSHARAWKNLASPKATEVGKLQGVSNPQTDAKCLKCHSTASSVEKNLISTITVEEGISCETCHGPGSLYKSQNIMKNIELSLKNGLKIPDEKNCLRCHNQESPTYKPFNYSAYKDKIFHNIPK